MQQALKIGVTYTGTDEKHTNYVNWLKGDDDIDIILLSPEQTDLDSIKDFDGIVLSGGIDMHPKFIQLFAMRGFIDSAAAIPARVDYFNYSPLVCDK